MTAVIKWLGCASAICKFRKEPPSPTRLLNLRQTKRAPQQPLWLFGLKQLMMRPFSRHPITTSVTGPARRAAVNWTNIPAWNTTSEKHQTPDISAVIQEVVSRGGWTSGNDLVLIISGSGERTAESYDGESSNAPLLRVEYSLGDNPPPPSDPPTTGTVEVRVNSSADDAEEAGKWRYHVKQH